MIQVTPRMRVLVAVEPADFRRGIDGLARVCREVLHRDPFRGWMFVFRNRRARAANWAVLGRTTGRGKNDLTHKANRPIKEILGYPLCRDFRQRLGSGRWTGRSRRRPSTGSSFRGRTWRRS